MNIKWYIDEKGTKVKKCARCKVPFPYTVENFSSRGSGKLSAYCRKCYKIIGKNMQSRYNKTSQKRSINRVFIKNGKEYKKCTSCGKVFINSFKFFDHQRLGQGGLRSTCKKCQRAYARTMKKINWQRTLLLNAKKSSNYRNFGNVEITEEYLLDLWKKQNGKCYWLGISMIPSEESRTLFQPSLDRLDGNKGYIKGNVVLCCFVSNFGRNQSGVNEWKVFLLKMKKELNFGMWE